VFLDMEMILRDLRRRRVAISGFEAAEAVIISRPFAGADAIASVVAAGQGLPGINPYAYYDICVLNCVAIGEEDSLIGQIVRSHKPVLLVGEAEVVAEKIPALAGVPTDFITRPYLAEELLLRADRLIGSIDANVSAAARPSSQRCVLIAEDEEVTSALIAAILRSAGFECASARDGVQALEMARRKKPDIVLLDLEMPRLDGFDTLAALRKEPETQHLPVIMVTGCNTEKDVERGFRLGADDYIVKPFNARELIARVDRAVRSAESRNAPHSPMVR
jgi:CheY-like chemotaxis protein